MNIAFIKEGKSVLVQVQKNEMFAEAVNRYCTKANIKKEDKPKFYFSNKEIPGDSWKNFEELGMPEMCRIDVILTGDVKGAFSF